MCRYLVCMNNRKDIIHTFFKKNTNLFPYFSNERSCYLFFCRIEIVKQKLECFLSRNPHDSKFPAKAKLNSIHDL